MKKVILPVLMATALTGNLLAAQKVTIVGSTTVLPIAQLAAEEFMNANPDIEITVGGGGSGVGIASIVDGSCDIGDASRAIKDKELQAAAARGVSPKAHVVAMDGIAVIVNSANGLDEITTDQIKAIYTGRISDWSQLGGNGGRIVVISRDSASGTYEAFNKLALNKAKVRGDALIQASNQQVASTVGRTPGAIGYVGLGYVTPSVKSLVVDGIECTKQTVVTGKYPLARPLFMYTNGAPKGATKAFIDYVTSEEGQTLAEEAGYVGLR